jgi:hypothetical protein
MNALAASLLAAGELVCEFTDGYRRSLIAAMAGDPPKVERILLYDAIALGTARVLDSRRAGRKPVEIRNDRQHVHLIQRDGASVRVTTLTDCTRTSLATDLCTRFAARHAWHFDSSALLDPASSLASQPSGAAPGTCEPWRVE